MVMVGSGKKPDTIILFYNNFTVFTVAILQTNKQHLSLLL